MMTDRESRQLFTDVKAGRKPFEAVYDAFFPALMAVAVRLLGNWADAGDIAIETLTKASEHLADPTLERNPSAWMFCVARRSCISLIRRRKPQGYPQPCVVEVTADFETPDISAEKNDYRIRLADCIRRLRPELREVIIRRFYEGQTITELAQRLSFAVGTIHERQKRGLDDLKKCLKTKGAADMSGWTTNARVQGLLKRDARRLVDEIGSAYKQTPACLTAQTLQGARDAHQLPDEMLTHIQSCRRCMTMAKIMGVLEARRIEDVQPADALADYLRRLADTLTRQETSADMEPLAVGYFAEQAEVSEEDRAALESYVTELTGLIDTLTDATMPIATKARLVAEIRDIATARLGRRPGHERGRSRK
jgi:RNA polymerase sigma-70 factor (ECF subfamily)